MISPERSTRITDPSPPSSNDTRTSDFSGTKPRTAAASLLWQRVDAGGISGVVRGQRSIDRLHVMRRDNLLAGRSIWLNG
jgi:hypothetical protein